MIIMLWYVLQTRTGEEEKMVQMIHGIIPKHLYGECFVVYHEQLWKRQQKNFVHVKRAFPGYVFITSKEPEALFFCLKQIPAMVKLLAWDENSFFLSIDSQEVEFLNEIMDDHHVIGLSYLEMDIDGKINQVSGPLKSCVSKIIYCRFGKRYVIVRLKLLGKEKNVLLGIILEKDIYQEVQFGKVEAPIQVPKKYQMSAIEKSKDRIKWSEKRFMPGDIVEVCDGAFKGMSGMVYQAGGKAVKIGIQLLGRTIEMELLPEILKVRRTRA